MTTDRELNLDALERKLIRDLHEWRPDHATLLRALIQRVREAEGENAALREGRVLIEEGLRGRWDGVYKMRARIAQLERVRAAAQAYSEGRAALSWKEGEPAPWELAWQDLRAALAAVTDDR